VTGTMAIAECLVALLAGPVDSRPDEWMSETMLGGSSPPTR
jgi:hypothetical protein